MIMQIPTDLNIRHLSETMYDLNNKLKLGLADDIDLDDACFNFSKVLATFDKIKRLH